MRAITAPEHIRYAAEQMRVLVSLLAVGVLAVGGLAVGGLACGDTFSGGDGGGGGGAAGATSSLGGAGSGGAPSDPIGCSDGTREYLTNPNQHPRIAGCQGAWDVPGVTSPAAAACGRMSGNDNMANPLGSGCSISDLCSAGWHVCSTAVEVSAHLAGECPKTYAADELWIARQTVGLNNTCDGSGEGNNVFGCGAIGVDTDPSCLPLNKMLIYPPCETDPIWRCGPDSEGEGDSMVKLDPSKAGGVLCCAD